MFLFGVAHWTAHRIHYDSDWARGEGYDDVLVPGPLMTAWQVDLVTTWAGTSGALIAMEERNVTTAFPGEVLTTEGEVASVGRDLQGATITCSTQVRAGDRVVVTGSYTVRLRHDPSIPSCSEGTQPPQREGP